MLIDSNRPCRARRWCCTLGMLMLLSGCAGLTPRQAALTPVVAAQATALAQRRFHDTIDIGGRLSLRYDQNGADQTLDGKFTWNQASGLTRITLLTPFGQTLATIDVTPQRSTLQQGGQPARSEPNVDSLVAGALGWPLPVAGLRDWLQGFALSEQGVRHVASEMASGDAAYVKTSDGWLIHYPTWQDARPRRIDLQRLTSQAGNVSLRIVIDQWQPS